MEIGFRYSREGCQRSKNMKLLKENKLAVFFDFKEGEDGFLHFAAVIVITKSLKSITQIAFGCRDTHSNITSESQDHFKRTAPKFEEEYNRIYDILHQKLVIGHGLLRSNWESFEGKCTSIGKSPPKPRHIIDIAYFARSNTKLAKLSLLLGLGNATDSCLDNCVMHLDVIMTCRTLMSILEMKKATRGYYPTICHLMEFPEEEEERTESTSDMKVRRKVDVGDSVVFFDFQKDCVGMLQLAAFVICTKTLQIIVHVTFSLHSAKPEKSRISSTSGTLYRSYDHVYAYLHEKTWIGYDVRKSCLPRLRKECEYIRKPPPTPKEIVDVSYFISSKTKLAKLAVVFGMGKRPIPTFFGYMKYLEAIEKCGDAMPILDMSVDSVIHPMISHIMEFQPTEDEEKSKIREVEDSKEKQKAKLF